MIRISAAILFSLSLSGCSTIQSTLDDDYNFGDITASITEMQARYCAAADPNQRAVILALLHRADVPIPERGACTDLLKLIDPGELSGIDVEAAQRDQERFQDDAR